ncbi:TPA: hypothetical protein ACKON3_001612 [Clostridioides difficile]
MKTAKGQICTTTIIKIIISILLITFGVLSLIFLRAQHIHYTIYVTVLMCCVAVASLLLLSCGILGILRHKNTEQKKLNAMAKWIYTISSGTAILIASPLIIILLSAQEISFTIFLPCFFIALVVPITLIVLSIAKCINICRS